VRDRLTAADPKLSERTGSAASPCQKLNKSREDSAGGELPQAKEIAGGIANPGDSHVALDLKADGASVYW